MLGMRSIVRVKFSQNVNGFPAPLSDCQAFSDSCERGKFGKDRSRSCSHLEDRSRRKRLSDERRSRGNNGERYTSSARARASSRKIADHVSACCDEASWDSDGFLMEDSLASRVRRERFKGTAPSRRLRKVCKADVGTDTPWKGCIIDRSCNTRSMAFNSRILFHRDTRTRTFNDRNTDDTLVPSLFPS